MGTENWIELGTVNWELDGTENCWDRDQNFFIRILKSEAEPRTENLGTENRQPTTKVDLKVDPKKSKTVGIWIFFYKNQKIFIRIQEQGPDGT